MEMGKLTVNELPLPGPFFNNAAIKQFNNQQFKD
jgi:hypothetical protein